MEVRGVFFDLYGTLLIYDNLEQGWYDWRKAFVDTLTNFGFDCRNINFDTLVEDFFKFPLEIDSNDDYTPYERRLAQFGKQFGYTLDSRLISKITDATVGSWHRHISLDPDVPTVLAEIRRMNKIALVSNFDHPPYVYRILEKYDIIGLFDHITISGEIGVEKPHPAVFAPSLKATGLEPGQVIFVGDSKEDIKGAKNVGMIPVLIDRNGGGVEADVIRIENLSQLPDLISGT